jgi:hypothetical protein
MFLQTLMKPNSICGNSTFLIDVDANGKKQKKNIGCNNIRQNGSRFCVDCSYNYNKQKHDKN